MKIEHTIHGLRAALRQARQAGKSIALVPTMGNLHEGHIALIQEAKARADFVVASIFVNPTQFAANEDFDGYPRTLEADSSQLAEVNCDILFAPSVVEMYPAGGTQSTSVHVAGITEILCGLSRPDHFDGVATVVSKLLNIVQPDMALFGEKDYQQLAVIRALTNELCFPLSIIGIATRRAEDGLALSSRNGFLSPDERKQAALLYQTLCQLRDAINTGMADFEQLSQAATAHLQKCGFSPDYLEVRQHDLSVPNPESKDLVILVAARLGKTRLIDNLAFTRP